MRTRIALLSVLAVAAVVTLGGAPAATAQQVVKFGDGQTLTISGFMSASLFANHGRFGAFGQGQNAELADSAQATAETWTKTEKVKDATFGVIWWRIAKVNAARTS